MIQLSFINAEIGLELKKLIERKHDSDIYNIELLRNFKKECFKILEIRNTANAYFQLIAHVSRRESEITIQFDNLSSNEIFNYCFLLVNSKILLQGLLHI